MSTYSFTATQVVYNFTATIDNPAALVLEDNSEQVNVVNVVSTITVINSIQPVTVTGSAGQSFNQSLNTTDNVAFNTLTVPTIYGAAQQPVAFPTGISTVNYGSVFSTALDLGQLSGTTITNQLSLIFAFLPLDFGTINSPININLNFGTII